MLTRAQASNHCSILIASHSRSDCSIYTPEACYQNVVRFAEEKLDPNVDVKKLNTLVLMAKSPTPDPLEALEVPFLATSSGVTHWIFHVVLEYQGEILDLDYANTAANPSLQDYFQEMFFGQSEAFQNDLKKVGLFKGISPLNDLTVASVSFEEYKRMLNKFANSTGINRLNFYANYFKYDPLKKYLKGRGIVLSEPSTQEILPIADSQIITIGSRIETDWIGGAEEISWSYGGFKVVNYKTEIYVENSRGNRVTRPDLIRLFLRKLALNEIKLK